MKPNKPAKDKYTVTEVGTLIESLRSEFRMVAEGHVGLDQRMERLEIEVHGNSRRLDHLELGFNVLDGKVSRLEDAVSLLSKGLKEVRQEVGTTRQELGVKIDKIGDRLIAVEVNR